MGKLLEEIKQNIIDATSFREPKKVPVGIDVTGWAFHYSGTVYRDIIDDPIKTCEAYTKIFNDIPVDYVLSSGISVVPIKAYKALGVRDYEFAEDGISITHNQAGSKFMSVEEYQELIRDPFAFLNETRKKRKVPAFTLPKQQAYEALKKSVLEYKVFQETNAMIAQYLTEEKQIYGIYDEAQINFYAPFDMIFDSLRGITNALTDLRRYPDMVRAACDAIWEYQTAFGELDPKDHSDPLPMGNTIYHSECFVSPAKFDEVFFKRFKETYLPFMEAGKKFYLFGEGRFMNTIERFRELPKGAMVILLESDDPFEAYQKVGDWCTLVTGISVDLLQTGTKQQCIDYVKKCFDTFAPGGGFMFQPNKELVSGKDAQIENLIAVYEAADELSRK